MLESNRLKGYVGISCNHKKYEGIASIPPMFKCIVLRHDKDRLRSRVRLPLPLIFDKGS